MKFLFSFLVILFAIVISESALAEPTDKLTPEQEFWSKKAKYEQILTESKSNNKESNNWIKRWLWDNRNGYQKPTNSTALYNSANKNSKENSLQSQKGWSPLGPINFPPSYDAYSGHGLGRTSCVAFHPTNKDIMWIAAANGGVWKTENYGKSWIPISDDLPTIAVSYIAVDPKNPLILYIASGDNDGGNGENLGIFKTTDGGNNWSQTNLNQLPTFNYGTIKKIIISSQNNNELIAVGSSGIWKSTDAGKQWSQTKVCSAIDIEVSSANDSIMYVAANPNITKNNAPIMKSTDFGSTWSNLITGIDAVWGQIPRLELAISPSDPNYIYAIGSSSLQGKYGSFHSFYASTDAGLTWTTKSTYQNTENIIGFFNGDSTDVVGQGTYNLVLLVDPLDKNKVYFGGTNIWLTTNAGKNWDMVSYWVNCFGKSIHADHHYASYNPLDKSFYFTNDGGIYRTKAISAGSKEWMNLVDKFYGEPLPNTDPHKYPTEWENISDGLAITQFYKVGLSKNNPDYVTGGAQDNSCFYYHKGAWNNYITNWDGMSTLIDHNNPEIIYGVWQQGGLCRSDDGGKKMINNLTDSLTTKLGETGNWVTPVDMDPEDTKLIYFGLRNFWKSTNSGKNWEKVVDFNSASNRRNIELVKASYSNSNYVSFYKPGNWVEDTTSHVWSILYNELWLTTDGGKNFNKVKQGLPTDSIGIIGIDYDKVDPRKMWVIFNNNTLFATSNAGENWNLVPKFIEYKEGVNNISFKAIAHYQKSSNNTLYVGTTKGVYYTNDSMTTWKEFNKNLPNCLVNDIAIQEISGKLYAATYGRGMWETSILESENSINDDNTDFTFDVMPNPSIGTFKLIFNSKSNLAEEIDAVLLDVLGRKVWGGQIVSKNNEIQKDFNLNLANGIYYLKLTNNGIDFTKKIIVRK